MPAHPYPECRLSRATWNVPVGWDGNMVVPPDLPQHMQTVYRHAVDTLRLSVDCQFVRTVRAWDSRWKIEMGISPKEIEDGLKNDLRDIAHKTQLFAVGPVLDYAINTFVEEGYQNRSDLLEYTQLGVAPILQVGYTGRLASSTCRAWSEWRSYRLSDFVIREIVPVYEDRTTDPMREMLRTPRENAHLVKITSGQRAGQQWWVGRADIDLRSIRDAAGKHVSHRS